MNPDTPWITEQELAVHLGASLAQSVAARLVSAASDAVSAVVDLDGATEVPDAIRTVTLMVAGEVYKAGVGVDGSMVSDFLQQSPAFITSNLLRRYGALLAPWLNVGGLVG
jgi:hypothetical protein